MDHNTSLDLVPVSTTPSCYLTCILVYLKNKAISAKYPYKPGVYHESFTGKLVDIELRPHDLRRHAATYASRSGTPIEIVSKVILRHADLSTTQRYLGKVNDSEAIRWIETLYG